ncbi:MAG: hypothetical protein NXI01_03015 [Gammaproteobacteria bacterium]|nr:hypothetical protein [Gammaproteobacteria bacterium]
MKPYTFIILLASCSVFAAKPPVNDQEKTDEQKRMKILSDLGLPLPGSGIKLVPRAKLHLSEVQLALGKKAEEEMKTLGYAIEVSEHPKELLNMRDKAKVNFKLNASPSNDSDTGLRPNIQNLKLAFKFTGITQHKGLTAPNNPFGVKKITLIGAAPQGGFHKEKGGWSGAAQFFDVKDIGTCSYGMMNVKASNTAAELAVEDVTYTINKKPTITTVQGSPNSGFIYKVEWFDDKNFHELECANMKYSPSTTKAVVNLAKGIDS